MTRERNQNIEALRCLLMFLIVFGHCCCHGAYAESKVALIGCTLTTFSVDAFAFVSGWFSIKLSLGRMIRFVGHGVFAFIAVNFIGWFCARQGIIDYKIGDGGFRLGWYGNGYLVVMLLAPFINEGVKTACRGGRLFRSLSLYLGFMFFTWLPFRFFGIDLVSSWWGGHSALLLVGLYLTGRVLSNIGFLGNIKVWMLISVLLCCELMVVGWSAFTRMIDVGVLTQIKLWDNRSPVIILESISVFMIFLKIRLPLKVARIVSLMAPSMFAIYLLHEGTGGIVFRQLYGKLELYLCAHFKVGIILSIFISAIAVYCGCFCVDMVRRTLILLAKGRCHEAIAKHSNRQL